MLLAGLATLLLGAIHLASELARERGDFRGLKATAEGCLIEIFGVSGYRVLVFAAVMMTNPIEATTEPRFGAGARQSGFCLPHGHHWQ